MNLNKILSGLIAAAYIVVSSVHAGTKTAFARAIFLILPLFCIWFSDAMGGYTGELPIGSPITIQSPGKLIRILGWGLLFLPIILVIIMKASV